MHQIRPARLEDIPALITLMAEFYGESNYHLPEANARAAFATLLADPRLGGVWIAWVDDEPVGHAVLTVGFSMEFGGMRGFVDDLFVRRPARGRGVATALLDAVMRECDTRGVRALLVEVGPDNAAARRLYERAGLVDSGRLVLSRTLASPLHVE
jgi:GNAT superfamily N-acetyltransferase